MFLSKIGEIYYVFIRDENGIRHKYSTRCRKKADALRFLHKFDAENALGWQQRKRIFGSAFFNEYGEASGPNLTQKTLRTYQTAFREFLRVEGDHPLTSYGIREIERFLARKKLEASEWTARKYYISLRSAFEKAVQWGYLAENPFRKVRKPQVRELQPAYFTEQDFRMLLSVIPERDQDFRDLCIVALLTGLRLGELLSLQWADVDLGARMILIRNSETFTTKTKKNRSVPMSEELCKVLLQRRDKLRVEADTVFHEAGVSDTILTRARADAVRQVGTPPSPPPDGLTLYLRLPLPHA